MAERIQRKRTKGWRMPEGAVYVGRPTKWGNPWCPCRREECGSFQAHSRAQAAAFYRQAVQLRDNAERDGRLSNGTVPTTAEIRAELAGKDLACWCPLGQPCHADVLLRVANGEAS